MLNLHDGRRTPQKRLFSTWDCNPLVQLPTGIVRRVGDSDSCQRVASSSSKVVSSHPSNARSLPERWKHSGIIGEPWVGKRCRAVGDWHSVRDAMVVAQRRRGRSVHSSERSLRLRKFRTLIYKLSVRVRHQFLSRITQSGAVCSASVWIFPG